MSPVLIAENIGKKYSRDLKTALRSGARTLLRSYFGDRRPSELTDAQQFWAVREVSFALRRGDVLAILGQNGAGKSTLLKCIAGKLRLDAGTLTRHGRIGHLLEMSAGFEATLSGRENVQLRGRLMDLRGRALEHYIGAVAEFAELDEFFDSPVQFYSSGMRARLGFAASSVMTPDILIIDEVLSVGDLSFRLKCYERINEMAGKAAVLFVSHSLGQVARMCNRALYLEKGRVLHDGDVQQAIALYQDRLGQGNEQKKHHVLNPELVAISLLVAGQPAQAGHKIRYGEALAVDINVSQLAPRSQLRILLRDASSGVIMDWNSVRNPFQWDHATRRVCAEIGTAELNPGAYAISLQVMSADGAQHVCLSAPIHFSVTGELYYALAVQKKADWKVICS